MDFGRLQSYEPLIFELGKGLLCGEKLPLSLQKLKHSIGLESVKKSTDQ
jgi:hypothetical protein